MNETNAVAQALEQIPGGPHDLLMALYHNPACLFIVLGLNLLGVMLQQNPLLPNRLNFVIPWLLFALAIVFTVLLVPVSIFPAGQQSPRLLLGIIGFCFGVLAWMIHTWPIQWLTTFLASKFGGGGNAGGGTPPAP